MSSKLLSFLKESSSVLSDYWMILMRCAALDLVLIKSGSCGPNFLCYVGGASAGVIFHPVSDNLKFFLLSIPVKTCGDHFLRI